MKYPTLEKELGEYEDRMAESFAENLTLLKQASKAIQAIKDNGFPREHEHTYNLVSRINAARKDAEAAEVATAARLLAAQAAIRKARPFFTDGSEIAKALDASLDVPLTVNRADK